MCSAEFGLTWDQSNVPMHNMHNHNMHNMLPARKCQNLDYVRIFLTLEKFGKTQKMK
jgi:hypothetical protein